MLAILPPVLFAQQPQFRNSQPPPILEQTTGSSAGFTGTEGLTNIPPGAFQPDRVGIAPQSLFRTSQSSNLTVAPPPLGPEVHSENVNAEFKLGLPTLSGTLPYAGRSFDPQDANLKIGPIFLKLRSIEAGVLHSDNVNLTPDDRQSGTIAITALTVDVIAQITESLRLASSATFVYFPIEGKAGVNGFGLADLYNFGLGPLAHAQVAWDTEIGGWHVVFMDNFQILEGLSSSDFRGNSVYFEGATFDEASRSGRYIFVAPQNNSFPNQRNENQDTTFRNNLVVYSNTLSADAERLVPGSVRLQLRVYHEDLWYNQGNRGLPSIREGASVYVASERDNLRFKPYFRYDAFRTDEFDGVQNIFTVGIQGPITDQLSLLAEVGYYFGGFGGNGPLWKLQLAHTAGPYTEESLVYTRQFTYFHDEIVEGIGYNLRQILGPRLSADAYLYQLNFQELATGSDAFNRNEWLAGASLRYTLGPKTTLRLTGEYSSDDLDGTQAWLGSTEVGYNFTDTLLLQFTYQYQKSTSQIFDLNYTENLFFLSLTKYFR